MQSSTKKVEEYLDSLPEDRRVEISQVREVILKNLPEGYEENMNWGMISYEVPLERYPDTYNKQPLSYAAIASQKNYISIYLMCAYTNSPVHKFIIEGFEKAAKKLDMGKSCIRFKKLEDIPLDVIGEAISMMSVEEHIKVYEESRNK